MNKILAALHQNKNGQPPVPAAPDGVAQPPGPGAPVGVARPHAPGAPIGVGQPPLPAAPERVAQPIVPAIPVGMAKPPVPAAPAGMAQPAAPAAQESLYPEPGSMYPPAIPAALGSVYAPRVPAGPGTGYGSQLNPLPASNIDPAMQPAIGSADQKETDMQQQIKHAMASAKDSSGKLDPEAFQRAIESLMEEEEEKEGGLEMNEEEVESRVDEIMDHLDMSLESGGGVLDDKKFKDLLGISEHEMRRQKDRHRKPRPSASEVKRQNQEALSQLEQFKQVQTAKMSGRSGRR